MSFDLKQLENFLVAAKYLNFTKAAEELYITQSALSKQISALETSLGTDLFTRRNNVITLTNAGQLLYSEGSSLMDKVRDIEFLMQEAASGTVGTLNVGLQDPFLSKAPNLYETFKKRYPNVTFMARFHPPDALPNLIRSGELDVGTLHSFDLPADQYNDQFGILRLYREKYAMIVPLDHPFASRKSVALEELVDQNIVQIPYISWPKAVEQTVAKSLEKHPGSYPDPVDFDDLLLQVKMGIGVAPLVKPIALANSRGCPVVEIEGDEADFDILLIWKKDNRNPSLPLFLELIKELFPYAQP